MRCTEKRLPNRPEHQDDSCRKRSPDSSSTVTWSAGSPPHAPPGNAPPPQLPVRSTADEWRWIACRMSEWYEATAARKWLLSSQVESLFQPEV
mmetsp:Transcript_29939/g.81793  ORF Transcript_29939/g.81793 Transcript_29939/m.81793 type:complete len:93 (-) Transcript_29939:436-714(-)|eukprot:scaffold278817_cov27-Tisochrysis_lutea.AAC.1